jgi:NAD(P) transhydrogenase subunit alpha
VEATVAQEIGRNGEAGSEAAEGSAPVVVGVPRETFPGETRVALVPATIPQLVHTGLDVVVERGAGLAAGFADDAYEAHGARAVSGAEAMEADVVVRVRGWGFSSGNGAAPSRPHQIVIGLADPLDAPEAVYWAAEQKLIAFALDLVPRISRAQAMDALSSQATITGYRAVLEAAHRMPKLLPMLTTAAGTVPPAQVFVIGAGVAGLQAIATARRLGAVVQAYDVRPAAQEDIESLGGRAVTLPLSPGDAQDKAGYAKELGAEFYRRQQELMANVVAGVDAVVTTALIAGTRAPLLLSAEAVARMQPGSVIVDIGAERGGNCELTRADEVIVTDNRVTVYGPTNLPARVPRDASTMYAKNVTAFLTLLSKDGRIAIDEEDEIVRGTLVARGGEIVNERVSQSLQREKAADV